MKNLLLRLEGLLLCFFSIYIFSLMGRGIYHFYMNPRFLVLTAGGTVLLFLFGILHMVYPEGRVSRARIVVLGLFLCLCFFIQPRVLGLGDFF